MTTGWRAVGGGAVVAVGVAASVAAASAYVRSFARGRIFAEAAVPATEVGVVLGAMVYPDGVPSPFVTARLDVALRLYRAGSVERLIVSGDSRAPEYDEPLAMRRSLLDAGVPPEAVIEDPDGYDTYETCLRARDVYGLRRFTLISQTYHLPRAVGTARLLGLDAIGVGDETVRILPFGRRSPAWLRGVVREHVACVKTLRDLRFRTAPRWMSRGGDARP